MSSAEKVLVGHRRSLEKSVCVRQGIGVVCGDGADRGLDAVGGEQWVLLAVEQQERARGDMRGGLGVVFGAVGAVHGVGRRITLVGH